MLSAGNNHTAALRSDGNVIAWGQNTNGQTTVPSLPGGTVYAGVAAWNFGTLALRGTPVAAMAPSLASTTGVSIGSNTPPVAGGLNVAGASSFGGGLSVTGTITGTSFSGSGASLTNLNASNITTGTLAAAQVPDLDASIITTGTITDSRLSTNVALKTAANAFGNFTNTFGGNVGIGTTTPAAALQIGPSDRLLDSPGGRSGGLITSGSYLGNTLGDDVALANFGYWCFPHSGAGTAPALSIHARKVSGTSGWTGTSVGFTQDVDSTIGAGGSGLWFNQGNIGIGTSTPSSALTVVGGGSGSGTLQLARALKVQSTASFGAVMSCDASNLSGGKDWALFSTGGNASEGQGRLIIRNDTDILDAMVITSDGNVGLGTYTPGGKLAAVTTRVLS